MGKKHKKKNRGHGTILNLEDVVTTYSQRDPLTPGALIKTLTDDGPAALVETLLRHHPTTPAITIPRGVLVELLDAIELREVFMLWLDDISEGSGADEEYPDDSWLAGIYSTESRANDAAASDDIPPGMRPRVEEILIDQLPLPVDDVEPTQILTAAEVAELRKAPVHED